MKGAAASLAAAAKLFAGCACNTRRRYKLAPVGLIGKTLESGIEWQNDTKKTRVRKDKSAAAVANRHYHFGSVLQRAAVSHNTYFLSNMTDGAQRSGGGGGTCNPRTDKDDDMAWRRRRPYFHFHSLILSPEILVDFFRQILPRFPKKSEEALPKHAKTYSCKVYVQPRYNF